MYVCRHRMCSRAHMLRLLILLVLLTRAGEWTSSMAPLHISGAKAAASPLSGTKQTLPWQRNPDRGSNSALPAGFRNIPTPYDVFRNVYLTKLLDVGACMKSGADSSGEISYVPPLDGTNPDRTLCQNDYGMRFVLFDLQLVNVAEVDALSGSFTAQLQLVFHWRDGWEVNTTDFFAYGAGNSAEDDASDGDCGFVCDTTVAAKKRCCDEMWVPQLQIPTCKINDLESVVVPPYLRTAVDERNGSFWEDEEGEYRSYNTRRTWYVGLDVTCPFRPEFHNFPFDYNLLTVDIINPYSSRTWLPFNKGFLDANIIDSVAGIHRLSPDENIGGWSITDLIVSSACATQQTWKPTFLTEDYLLQILGVGYTSQSADIKHTLDHLTCAEIKNLILNDNSSLSNPTNKHPYNQTKNDYLKRLNATITRYKECNSKHREDFKWNSNVSNVGNLPLDIHQFNVSDPLNMNRSFNFLDFQFQQDPSDGVNFQCVIEAIANLTTPGIRISIIIRRHKWYYLVKLILPTCTCVAFAFLAFGLQTSELLGRLTVIVPSAIALSTLQGFVVSTDIPAIAHAYTASTTWVVLSSYGMQLLIAIESICFSIWDKRIEKKYDPNTRIFGSHRTKGEAIRFLRIIDIVVGTFLFAIYVVAIVLLTCIPCYRSQVSLKSRRPILYESIWVKDLI